MLNTFTFIRSRISGASLAKLLTALLLMIPLLMSPKVGQAAAGRTIFPLLPTVSYVDLTRYAGLWYDIAHNPAAFQSTCVGTTATYTPQADGTVGVYNACYLGSFDGELNEIYGSATVADPSTNAKLSVSFPKGNRTEKVMAIRDPGYFAGNYWVLDLAADYSYAIVGEPTRKYCWILSRTSSMEPELYDRLVLKLQSLGYDTSSLQMTPHQ